MDALEQSYSVDSTKADTLFVTKILAFSEQRLADTNPRATAADTARYVKWAQFGAKKYPNSVLRASGAVEGVRDDGAGG